MATNIRRENVAQSEGFCAVMGNSAKWAKASLADIPSANPRKLGSFQQLIPGRGRVDFPTMSAAQSSWPALCRPSTSFLVFHSTVVDGRAKPGQARP